MYVRVAVKPSAKKESVIQTDDKTFAISVKEPAARNLANERVKRLLAAVLGVPFGRVRLVSGHRSPRKIFDIDA